MLPNAYKLQFILQILRLVATFPVRRVRSNIRNLINILQRLLRRRLPAFLHPPKQVMRVFLRLTLGRLRFRIAPMQLQLQTVHNYLLSAS